MKCLAYAFLTALLSFTFGCREADRELNAVRRDIDRFPDLLLTTTNHPIAEMEFMTARICALPTREQKDECFEIKAFCIEFYASHAGVTGAEAYRRFEKSGLLKALDEDYEDLHGMSWEALMQMFDQYLGVKKK